MGAPVGSGLLVNSSASLSTYTDSNGGSAYTVGSGSNRAVVITVSGYLDSGSNAGGASAMVFGTHSIANSEIAAIGSPVQSGASWVQKFIIVNPTSGSSSFSITASFLQRAMVVEVTEYNDIDQTTPVGSNIGTYSNASSATATGTLTTTAANSTLEFGICHEADFGTVTAGDGGTLVSSTATNGGTSFSDCTGAVSYEVLTGSSGVSVSTSISGTDTDNTVGQLIELIPAASGTPVGRADETDTALALGGVQIIAVGLASEAETALALSPVQILAVGLATEADTALALSPVQILPLGIANDNETAIALSPVQIIAVGLASEADTALALSPVQILAVGLATEADTALALSPVQILPPGIANDNETAIALSPVQIMAAGLAVETETALALVAVSSGAPPRRTVIPPGRAIQPGRPGQTTYRRPPNISRGTR